MPAATNRTFFLIPSSSSLLLSPLPSFSIFSFQGRISMSLWGFHKLLAFPGATGCSWECRGEGKRGILSPGRARLGQELAGCWGERIQGSDGDNASPFPTSFARPNVSNSSWPPQPCFANRVPHLVRGIPYSLFF